MKKLSRREFLNLAGISAAAAALAACGQPSPQPTATAPAPSLTPPLPTLSPALTPTPSFTPAPAELSTTAVRLMRRITFAPLPADLESARKNGIDAYLEDQLSTAALKEPQLERRLAGLKTLSMPPLELSQIEKREQPPTELTQATLLRAVYSKRQLYELVVDFWSNHFNMTVQKNAVSYLKTVDDREVIRSHALGSFRDLLFASAHSPAMLVYLDNVLSNKDKPNENYARELLELHTLGVDGGYTQDDVKAAARALTGWMVNGPKTQSPGTFLFNPRIHDEDEKVILGKKLAAKRGIKDGEDLLDLLANHPSTARFVSRKLVQHFVSDTPPAALVEKAAAVFTQSKGDITKVLGVILRSDEIKASFGQKVRRPFEFIAAALRVTQAEVTPDRAALLYLDIMGQPLFRLQTPDGYPDVASAWITTNGLMGRWNFSLALASNSLKDCKVDLIALLKPNAGGEAVLNRLGSLVLGEALPAASRAALLKFLDANPTEKALPALTALALSTPLFQYR